MAELRLGCTGWVETEVPFFCRIGALSNHASTFNPRRFVNPTTYIGWRSVYELLWLNEVCKVYIQ